MPDYGHDIQFGYFLSPDAADAQAVLETARLTDELGYDLLGVQDHPYQRRHLDALALLGVILASTERIRVFLDVGNLPLRPPAVFAKAAATLDVLSGGRFEAGLGAGGYLDVAHRMGAPSLTPRESLAALEEAIPIMRASWEGIPPCVSTGLITSSTAPSPGLGRRIRFRSGWGRTSHGRWPSRVASPTAGSAR